MNCFFIHSTNKAEWNNGLLAAGAGAVHGCICYKLTLFCSSGHHGWTFAKITWHLSVTFMIVMLIFDEAWVSHSTAVQISCVPSKIDSIKRKTLMLEVYIYILSWPVQGTHSTFKGQVYTVDKIKAIFSEDTVSFYDLIRPCCSWNAIIKLQSYDITTAWLVGCNDSPGAAPIMIFWEGTTPTWRYQTVLTAESKNKNNTI